MSTNSLREALNKRNNKMNKNKIVTLGCEVSDWQVDKSQHHVRKHVLSREIIRSNMCVFEKNKRSDVRLQIDHNNTTFRCPNCKTTFYTNYGVLGHVYNFQDDELYCKDCVESLETHFTKSYN